MNVVMAPSPINPPHTNPYPNPDPDPEPPSRVDK